MEDVYKDGILLYTDRRSLEEFKRKECVENVGSNKFIERHTLFDPIENKRFIYEICWFAYKLPTDVNKQLSVLNGCICGMQIQGIQFLDGVYHHDALNYVQARVRV